MLQKILLQQQSRVRLAAAFVGALLGTLILLSAIQLYFDLNYLFTEKADDVISPTYLEVNKQVSLLNTLSLSSSGFTAEEIAELRNKPYISQVGVFTPTHFSLWLSGEVGPGLPKLQTDLFLEGLPDEMIDIQSAAWHWKPGQKEVPIIIPSYFLPLYNFAFAPSKGLPQVTKGTITRIPMKLEVTTSTGERVFYKVRVIDFSDRINTLMAPLSFIEWANQEYGRAGEQKPPSRLVVKMDNPSHPEFAAFLESKGYETSRDKLRGGKQMALLTVVLMVMAVVGGFIVILAVLIFVLLFELLITQAKEHIRLLIQLGYDYREIQHFFARHFLKLFLGVQVFAFLCFVVTKYLLHGLFAQYALEVPAGIHWATALSGVAFVAVFSLLGVRAIGRTVRKLAE